MGSFFFSSLRACLKMDTQNTLMETLKNADIDRKTYPLTTGFQWPDPLDDYPPRVAVTCVDFM